MLQDVKDLTASGVMKGLNTQYNFLALQKDQSPNMMDVKINYDGSIEKRLGTTTQNTVTITGGSSSTLGFNPTTSGILTSFEAYWNLNQTSGDRSDQVGTSVLQSYNSVNYASGIKNQSALFVESSSQYLKAASSAIFSGNTNFSYSTWFFLNSTGGTVNRTLVAKRGTTSGSLDLFRPGDITTGLVGYWKFNNDATDSSSNGNNLTAVNTPTYVANGNYWKDEYIADLEDGSSQYYTLADASQTGLDITGSFTIATWIKRESADQHTIVAKGVTDTSGYRFYFSGTHNPVLTLAGTSVTSTETIATTGKHIHLAVTFDTVANVVNFYQDGNLLSSHSNSTDPTDNAEAFRIGSKSDAAAALWDGQLKDVAMWNVALTPIQIKSLAMGVDLTNMAYRPNNVSTQPTHWWKLNEISGNRADSVSTGPVTLTDNNSVLSSGGYIEGVGADFERANTESLEAADSADWDFGTGDYSVSAWIKVESVTDYYILSRGTSNIFDFYYVSGNLTIYQGGAPAALSVAWVPAVETWYHLVIKRTSGTLKLFIDGVEAGSASHSGDITSADALIVGYSGNKAGADAFDGEMQDLAIWKGYAVTDAEIASLAAGIPVQQQGIVSYWKMDEASGNAVDSIGTNTGVETGGTIGTATGKVDQARDFEAGDTEYFEAANSDSLDIVSDLSILYWAKPESVGILSTPINKARDSTGYGSLINTDNRIFFTVANDGIASTTTVSAGAWIHFAGAYTCASKQVFINSAKETDTAYSTNPSDTAAVLRIGADEVPTEYFDGLLDEMILAKRYFRPEEIKTIYIKGLNGKEATSTEVSSGGVGGFEYSLHVGSDNLVTFDVSSSGTAVNGTVKASSFGAVGTGTWYNAICWYDSANEQIGVVVNNTSPVISTYTAGVLAGSSLLTLGVENTAHYMDGRIDEVGFWTKSITSDAWTILYNAGSGNTYASGVDTKPWASFDFGAGATRWLTCAAGTGVYASSNLGVTWVNIATDRSATYQYIDRSKNVAILTSDAYDNPLYWAGSGSTYASIIGTSTPLCKYSINFQGFLILLNSSTAKRSFNYIDENFQLSSTAWLNFDLPSSADDEITAAFILRRYLYVSTRYKLYRISYVAGNPDWQYVEIKNWGFIPRTVKKVVIMNNTQQNNSAYSIGEVAIGLTWDRKLRIFDGSGDQILSNNIEKDNGMCDFALDKIPYIGSGPVISHAELDPIPNVYRLCVAMGQDSDQTTHVINYDGRSQALYPYANMPFNTMCVAESANRQYLMAFDRVGYCHMMDSGNLDSSTTAINEFFESAPMFEKSPSQSSKSHKTDMFFSNTTSGSLYYQDRTDFSNTFKDRRKFVIGGSTQKILHYESVDVPETYNVYQFRVTSSAGTSAPWRLQRYDHFTKGLGIGKNN